MKEATLKDYLHALNIMEEDMDMQVDGTDCYLAVCGGDIRFSPKALEYFAPALKLKVKGACIMGSEEKNAEGEDDYDVYDKWNEYGIGNGGPLANAEELLWSLAGYCNGTDYDIWFEDKTAELI